MPDDPTRPPAFGGRIIVPGAGPAPEGGARIVLPPGVSRDTPEGLPERPRLRPLVLVPFRDGPREFVLVNDPLGVMKGPAVLGIEALGILQLLDGTVSMADLSAAVMRESKDLRVGNMVKEFVAQLDEQLMLESPRFEAAYRALRDDYHRLEVRPAALEGHSYPADRDELQRFLDGHAAEAARMREAAGEPVAAPAARPRAILAPHLDPRRAGAAIARAYLELGAAGADPLRVVVFGTGHALAEGPVALTRKHFETPLGTARCDTAFVDRVAARLGEAAYRGELAHRDEHSIEFQALYLLHRLGGRPFTIVPILCGGFHALLDQGRRPEDDAAMSALVEAVRDAESALGGATVYVAGVDFSHVGPRFGDPPVDEPVRDEVRARDQAALGAAEHGDAAAWFDSIAQHDDSTRICGFAPTWAMLRCAEPGAGRMLHYEQSAEDDTTIVSVAAVAWP